MNASKSICITFTVLMVLGLPFSVFAGEGNALVPLWFKDSSNNTTSLFISNISNETVTVYITLFEEAGEVFDEDFQQGVTNFLSARGFSGDPLSSSGATLEPNKTGEFRVLGVGPTETGYGTIRWTSNGDSRVALIGTLRHTYDVPSGIGIALINNGEAF